MINLEPIPKKIQERLKEKMNVMGRTRPISPNESKSKSVDYGLTHAKMATRSTFLRMTSGQLNPVILMGGKLKDDGTIPGGYKDIYGQRTYRTGGSTDTPQINDPINPKKILRDAKDAVSAESYNTVNNLKRPTPGVKSVEASFKGGVKANREATISWTCWDWTELDLLMPHFLAHGKTVLVEWGWVYDKATLQNLPNFVKTDTAGNKFISADVYNNYKNKVVDENGDFDLMVGVIKNFEYTTREDGGFDCQTIISSVGVNLLDTKEPNKGFVDPSIVYNIDINNTKEITEQLEKSTGEESGLVKDPLIQLNTTVAFKAFLSQIDDYLALQLGITLGETKTTAGVGFDTGYISNENKYILDIQQDAELKSKVSTKYTVKSNGAWVRWGWFEDNIFSKFISLTPKNKNDIVSQFRSVESIINTDGTEKPGKFESVKIRNGVDLETVDINSYILPGQFYPLEKRELETEDGENNIILPGDVNLVRLKTEVDKFPDFSTKDVITDKKGKPIKSKRVDEDGKTGVETPGKFGYLRNMLINTKLIKNAFGAMELPDKIEPQNLFEGIEGMFSALNAAGGLNFWNFKMAQDDTDHQRVKIMDDSTTAVDFNKPVKDQRTKFNSLGEIQKPGIFYFPVWQHDSIVKRQNVNAKVPSSLQIATMYGSNVNAVGEFGSTDSSFGAEGVAAGAISNSEKDRRLEGLNIAIKNTSSKDIGLKSGNSEEPLTIDDGEDILDFLQSESVQEKLTKSYEEIRTEIADRIRRDDAASNAKYLDELSDPTILTPSTDFLTNEQLLEMLDEDNYEEGDLDTSGKDDIFRKLKRLFGRKFIDGVIKPSFKEFVSRSITGFGNTSNENIPLLIPLELELDIDGIGGIYPGNSFHSTYVPVRYQEHTVFQAKDVNHRLDSTGWTTTISGIMRTTLNQLLLEAIPDLKSKAKDPIKNYQSKVKQQLLKSKARDATVIAKADVAATVGNIQGGMAGGLISRGISRLYSAVTNPFKSDIGQSDEN
tara:strand:- start:615 stop:3620 length:3006 start_codon:yes stop_codon:yes gene_type:complete